MIILIICVNEEKRIYSARSVMPISGPKAQDSPPRWKCSRKHIKAKQERTVRTEPRISLFLLKQESQHFFGKKLRICIHGNMLLARQNRNLAVGKCRTYGFNCLLKNWRAVSTEQE